MDLENTQVINRQLIDRIVEAEDGSSLTKIAAAATKVIRTEIREEGFLRKIIPATPVTNDDLDRVVEHDRPLIIEEIEAKSKGALSVPFNVSTDIEFYYGPKGVVEFHQIKTPRYTKNINELRTYRHDIRKHIVEQGLNDIQLQEDGSFMKVINRVVGSENAPSPYTGIQQNFVINGGLTRNNYIEAKKFLEKMRLRTSVVLMNTSTAKEFEKFHFNEWGGPGAEDVWKKGLVGGISDGIISGVKHIFTIKDELVPDNVMYMFAEPDYLGRFYVLQDVTMYVKKEEDIISMNATETIGLGILNAGGVVRVRFAGA